MWDRSNTSKSINHLSKSTRFMIYPLSLLVFIYPYYNDESSQRDVVFMCLKDLINPEELAECLEISLVSAQEMLEGIIKIKRKELIKIGMWLERNKK